MAYKSNFAYILPRITPGGTRDTVIDKLNAPIDRTESALQELSERIEGLGDKSCLVKHYAPLSGDCYLGCLVYYNHNHGHLCYEPAVAKEPYYDENSIGTVRSLKNPEETYVEGIVVSLGSSVTGTDKVLGTVLFQGAWQDQTLTTACLGVNAQPGVYYLGDTPGSVAPVPSDLINIPVLQYHGEGKIQFGPIVNQQHANTETPGVSELATAEETREGKDIFRAVTPKGLSDACVGLKGRTGYMVLPGGFIFQWGRAFISNNDIQYILFPVTFPTACVSLTAHAVAGTLNGAQVANVSYIIRELSAGKFMLKHDCNGTAETMWFAIGY